MQAGCEITGVMETEDTRQAKENYLQGAESPQASLQALSRWTDNKIDETTSTWLWETVTPPAESDTNSGLYMPSQETVVADPALGEPLPLVSQQSQIAAMPSYTMELSEEVQQADSVSFQDPSANSDHWTEIVALLLGIQANMQGHKTWLLIKVTGFPLL